MHTDDIDPHICTVESLQVYTFVGQKVEFTISASRQDGFCCTRGVAR